MWAFSINFHFQLFFSCWCESQAKWTKGSGFVMHFQSWESGVCTLKEKNRQTLLSVNPYANWPKRGLLSYIVDGSKAYIMALWCKTSFFFLPSGWVLQKTSLQPAREKVLDLASNFENGTSAACKELVGEHLKTGKKWYGVYHLLLSHQSWLDEALWGWGGDSRVPQSSIFRGDFSPVIPVCVSSRQATTT